jgi:hypothetical protein
MKAGDDLVVIAFRDTTTGDLIAHRMEASEAFGQGAVSPEPSPVAGTMHTSGRRPQDHGLVAHAATHFPIARQGNASWFCCGNVSGCGQCGSSGGGYCSGCRSDAQHMAWPLVSSCTAPCVGCCLPGDFPRYGCDTRFYCENACSGWTTIVTIKDCGPNPRCRSTGCQSYDSVRFDLTPCAFSAIHGDFALGHANVWFSAPV